MSAEKKEENTVTKALSALKFRSIGPALMSGRIADLAIDPVKPNTWYVAVGFGQPLEDRERGNHLDTDLRQLLLLFDRLRDDRPQRPAHDLGRHGRERERSARGLWRWSLCEP